MNDIAILVLTSEKYEDLIPGFLICFFKNIKVKFKLYLQIYNLKIFDSRITNIYIKTNNWSDSLIMSLDHIEEKYVLIILEDIYIVNFDQDIFFECFQNLQRNNGDFLNILGYPTGNDIGQSIDKVNSKTPYSITAIGVWKKDSLKNILKTGENPWKFEILGSKRALKKNLLLYVTKKNLLEHKNMVEKGKWVKNNLIWGLQKKLISTSNVRKINSALIRKIKIYIFEFLIKIPFNKYIFLLIYKLRK